MQMEKISLLKKYLTPELHQSLKAVKTVSNFSIDDAIRSGVENPDSSVGVYAGDAPSYAVFSALLDPVIQDYHSYKPSDNHSRNLNVEDLGDINELDPSGDSVISTRIRVGRNLRDYPFAPAITKSQRLEVEKKVVEALATLTGDLAGQYYSLSGMPEDVRVRLVADHFLFKKGDRFLESAGANRDWPEARGIFHSANKQFLVWVNEEDQLRIISMQPGGNVREVFARLATAINTLEKKLKFAYNDHLGYLSSCPTNLGTAMRASVHVKLPKLSKTPEFQTICASTGLSIRGIHGEHSESEGGVYDISNKKRLGISEVEIVKVMANGVKKLLELERKLA